METLWLLLDNIRYRWRTWRDRDRDILVMPADGLQELLRRETTQPSLPWLHP